MTITLAAVYTPIGIQEASRVRSSGVCLYAGRAVIVSGIVALTLSPMMSSRMLREGDAERGYAGWVNRRFEAIRKWYSGVLTRPMGNRAAVVVFSAFIALLIVPLAMYRRTNWPRTKTRDSSSVSSMRPPMPRSTR